MHVVIPYLIAALLFGIGGYGVLRRRNAILVLMAVELMLNAVNLIFITADATVRSQVTGSRAVGPDTHLGGVAALFVIVLAAAEVGVGLAIVLQFYRLRASVAVTDVSLDPVVDPDPEPEPELDPDAEPDAEPEPDVPDGAEQPVGAEQVGDPQVGDPQVGAESADAASADGRVSG